MSDNPNVREQKEFYDDYWRDMKPIGSYKVQRTQWFMNMLIYVTKQLQNGEPKLLDLGCGDGRLVPLWKEIAGAESYGLELSPEAVKNANNRYPFIEYKEGDATQTGYESDFFDIIVCQEVIEHVEDQKQLVKECARILKPNGYLILTTPNKYYFDRRKGGNYSNQPIENIVNRKELSFLVSNDFHILNYETLIYAKGDFGSYRLLTNRYLLGLLRRLSLDKLWKRFLLQKGYGLHHAMLLRKR